GVCSSRQKGVVSDVLVRKRLRLLIDLWRPVALILKNPPRVMQKLNHRRKGLLERIETEARKHRIPVRILECNPVGSQGERLTKYEIAWRVAERFPVLTRELPPKRRAWESEHYRMSIFAAAALAMAQLHAKGTSTPAMPKRRPRMALASSRRKKLPDDRRFSESI